MPTIDWDSILSTLPRELTRKDVGIHFGNIISPRYLANLDSLGEGPAKSCDGWHVRYRREDFVAWLKSKQHDAWD